MRLVPRLQPFTTTIFAEMSTLAARTGALNLGQGFPDEDGPTSMLEIARAAIAAGVNQYPPGPGQPDLRAAISESRLRDYGQAFDPEAEVLVTVGATQAIAAAVIALVDADQEVLMVEPHYDSYPVVVAMAGARHRSVPLRPAVGRFALDLDEFAAAITPASRLLLLNSPHNPTGTVLNEDELTGIAELAVKHDLLVVSDEVYEHLTFDGARHRPIGTLPGMAERTLTVSSAGKTFSATGWKIGWVCGPAALVAAVRTAQQFLTYSGGAPFQPAVAHALRSEMGWVAELRHALQHKRDGLCAGLSAAGFHVLPPQGTYFATVDLAAHHDPTEKPDGMAFCLDLPRRAGVVAVPAQVFYDKPADGARYVRFAFCKRQEVIDEAVRRLAAAGSA